MSLDTVKQLLDSYSWLVCSLAQYELLSEGRKQDFVTLI